MKLPYSITKSATEHFPADRPVLPEWTRWAWASVNERGWWQPYIADILKMWAHVERESVAAGIRDAAWVPCTPEQLPTLTQWAIKHGLVVLAADRLPVTGASYTSANTPINDTDRWQYRVLITKPEFVSQLTVPFDDRLLGHLLGYPECCQAMFHRTWGAGQVDSTYDAIANGGINGPVEANILWRWLGVRWVPHMPCSFTCPESVAFGYQFRELAVSLGYREEVKAVDTILNWPVRWSAVNGIAEIVTPALKLSTRTDWSPERRFASRDGVYQKPEPHLWLDNGFKSPDGMRTSHGPLLDTIVHHVPQGAKVVDLGCGNGLLLKRAKLKRPDLKIAGCDIKADAISRAKSDLIGSWAHETIQTNGWTRFNADTVIISPVRLVEMTPEDREAVLAALYKVPHRIVYAYGDCLHEYGSLAKLCAAAGLRAPAVTFANDAAHVGLVL